MATTTEFEKYFDGLIGRLGLSHIKGSWEDVWIQNGEVKLYAPVFLAVEAAGSREGRAAAVVPTVVFIPGTSVYALIYAELMHGLSRAGFNVVGFDPRGQGQSGGRRGDYTILEHVADARAVCAYARARFPGPVFVMGSSQGGIEAFYLAATEEPLAGAICHNLADLPAPESIRLTRFGPKWKGRAADGEGGTKASAHAPVSKPMLLLARTMVGALKLMAEIFPRLPVPISAYLDLKQEPHRVFGNAWELIKQDPLCLKSISLRAFVSIAGTPLPRPISEIKTPILVLHSSRDNIFPEDYIRRLYDQLTCAKELQVYPDFPHLITLEHVAAILPGVVRWIRERDQARR